MMIGTYNVVTDIQGRRARPDPWNLTYDMDRMLGQPVPVDAQATTRPACAPSRSHPRHFRTPTYFIHTGRRSLGHDDGQRHETQQPQRCHQ